MFLLKWALFSPNTESCLVQHPFPQYEMKVRTKTHRTCFSASCENSLPLRFYSKFSSMNSIPTPHPTPCSAGEVIPKQHQDCFLPLSSKWKCPSWYTKIPLPRGVLLDTGSFYMLDTNQRSLTLMSCASLLSLEQS